LVPKITLERSETTKNKGQQFNVKPVHKQNTNILFQADSETQPLKVEEEEEEKTI